MKFVNLTEDWLIHPSRHVQGGYRDLSGLDFNLNPPKPCTA